jgi:cytochrome b6-f complex iron-sulfur subunit
VADATRRRFLELALGAGTLPLGAAACSSTSGGPENVGDISAGNESALTVGTLKGLGSQPACIGRDADGVYAMTLMCTHQSCNMASQGSVGSTGISCSCHGSRFDVQGNVTRGPATSGLAHFLVSADASGNLTVHTGSVVAATVRLKV